MEIADTKNGLYNKSQRGVRNERKKATRCRVQERDRPSVRGVVLRGVTLKMNCVLNLNVQKKMAMMLVCLVWNTPVPMLQPQNQKSKRKPCLLMMLRGQFCRMFQNNMEIRHGGIRRDHL